MSIVKCFRAVGELIAAVVGTCHFFMSFAMAEEVIPPTLEKSTRIAVVGPLTPSSKAFGIPQLQGATLAIDEYNNASESRRNTIKLQIIDDESSSDNIELLVRDLVNSNVAAVIGPANSSVAKAIIDASDRLHSNLPFVSPLATNSNLIAESKWKGFFRANVSDRKRLGALLSKIYSDENLRPRRIILAYENRDSYGEGLLADAKAWLQKNHSEMLKATFAVPYERNLSAEAANDLVNNIVGKGNGNKQDAILLLGIGPDAITIIDVLRKRGIEGTIYFSEPDHTAFKAAAARQIDISGVHVVSVFWPDSAKINDFTNLFKGKFDEDPPFSAALAYDATRLIIRAIDMSQSEQVIAELRVSALRDRVARSLQAGSGGDLDFAVSGDHHFENNEFVSLDFQGLQYKKNGELVQWGQAIADDASVILVHNSNPSSRTTLPSLYILLLVAISGYLGSLVREASSKNVRDYHQFLIAARSPVCAIVDPVIAIIVFSALFIILLFTKPDLLILRDNALTVYVISAIAIGALSGASGFAAIEKVLSYLKVEKSKPKLVD